MELTTNISTTISALANIQIHKTGEQLLYNLLFADTLNQVLVLNHNIKLPSLFEEEGDTINEICQQRKFCQHPTQAIISYSFNQYEYQVLPNS